MKEGLIVKNINAGYDKKRVLEDVSITADMGKVTAILVQEGESVMEDTPLVVIE